MLRLIVTGLMCLLLPLQAYGRDLRVAIFDTGVNTHDPVIAKHLCPESEHYNPSTDPDVQDFYGHGTPVTHALIKAAGDVKGYCIVVVKFFDSKYLGQNSNKTFAKLLKDKLNEYDYVNMSFANSQVRSVDEENYIKLSSKTKFFISSGNEGYDLDVTVSYPQEHAKHYSNVYLIGGIDKYGKKVHSTSSIAYSHELSIGVQLTNKNGITDSFTGTSFACPTALGKHLRKTLLRMQGKSK